ncbi:catalase [Rhodanobacter sp. C05]|uniref:catalase n=1 Tax=Rhodanobacter sp. C05 TaxID=1945855 RepID=UPI0027391B19|nr:catalase [Rhodanobacter sp. C05]
MRGPLPLQDVALFEKHMHFHRERISERVVHANASAAFGTLTITHDITRHTRAKLFQPGTQTPMSGTFPDRSRRPCCQVAGLNPDQAAMVGRTSGRASASMDNGITRSRAISRPTRRPERTN